MHLRKCSGCKRVSVVERSASVVGVKVVLLFLITSHAGGWNTLLVAGEEAKREITTNSEEVKQI